jgi:uncharacterized integral membrane protein
LFRTLGTILKWVILLPILAAIVLLAVGNDQSVTVHLNPFDTGDAVLRVDLPLYQIAFGLFALGVVVGGLIVWANQAEYRRRARDRSNEAALWQARAEWTGKRQAEAAPSKVSAFLPRPERG